MSTETKKEKSLVSHKIPRRFGREKDTFLAWHEFRLKTRLMPNGYRVTLAAVQTASRIVLGASACSPLDKFGMEHAYNLALGRARQQAWQVVFKKAPFVSLLISLASIPKGRLTGGNGIPLQIIGPIIEKGWGILDIPYTDGKIPGAALSQYANQYYPVVAQNAEIRNLVEALRDVQTSAGGRFNFSIHPSVLAKAAE